MPGLAGELFRGSEFQPARLRMFCDHKNFRHQGKRSLMTVAKKIKHCLERAAGVLSFVNPEQ